MAKNWIFFTYKEYLFCILYFQIPGKVKSEHGIYLLIHVWVVFYMDKSMCGKNIPTSTCLHIATFSNLGYVSSEVEFSCQNVQPFGT